MRILVVGDVMVDRYIYVKTNRRAAEADIPIWDQIREEVRPGGAANVARNIKAIGGDEISVHLAGIGSNWKLEKKEHELETDWLIGDELLEKRRYVNSETGEYLFRHDNIQKFSEDAVRYFESMFEVVVGWDYDAVVVADYDKGTVSQKTVELIRDIPLSIVDSKRKDLRIFKGMDVLKVNEEEYAAQVSSRDYANFTEFFQYCIATKGAKGSDLLQCEHLKSGDRRYIVHSERFPAEKVPTVDVTGCGDTFTAALAFSLLKNKDIRSAVKFANVCASKVVQKFGTTVI